MLDPSKVNYLLMFHVLQYVRKFSYKKSVNITLYSRVLGKVINYQEKLYIMRHKVEYKFAKQLNYIEKSIYPKCI